MSANLTPRQQAWFASVKASLERDTGKPVGDWIEIVKRDCPESERRKQEAWLRATYGMSMIRAGQIINALSPEADPWEEAQGLRTALWTDAASTAILDAFEATVAQIADVIPTQRKGYSAWSRKVQFAALKPLRGGTAALGLAVSPESDSRLRPYRNESWSERLKSTCLLSTPGDIDDSLVLLVHKAWQNA